MENHVSFVKRSLRADSASTTPTPGSRAEDGAYTPEDSGAESGDDERTIVEAEKADGLFRGEEADWRPLVDEELDDLKADAEKPLDEILTVLPPEYLETMMTVAARTNFGIKPDTDDEVDEDDDDDVSSFASAHLGAMPVDSDDGEDEEEEGDMECGETNEQSWDAFYQVEEDDEEEENEVVTLWKSVPEKDVTGQDKWIAEIQKTTAPLLSKADEKLDEREAESASSPLTLSASSLLLFRGTLRDYQRRGVVWLAQVASRRYGAILADEKGLGKTVQVAALCAWLAAEKGDWGPHLILAPAYAMSEWEGTFKKFFPGCKVFSYFGNARERRKLRAEWLTARAGAKMEDAAASSSSSNAVGAPGVFITSYLTASRDAGWLTRRQWRGVFFDEMQYVKDFADERWQSLKRQLRSTFRVIITNASPSKSSANELWAWLEFLFPRLFLQASGGLARGGGAAGGDFRKWLSLSSNGQDASSSSLGDKGFQRLLKLVRALTLRRSKSDLERQLPQREDHVMLCRMSPRQRLLYEDLMDREETKAAVKQKRFSDVMGVFMKIKRLASHPELMEEGQPDTPWTITTPLAIGTPRRIVGVVPLSPPGISAETMTPTGWSMLHLFTTMLDGDYECRRAAELKVNMETMRDVISGQILTSSSSITIKKELDAEDENMDVSYPVDASFAEHPASESVLQRLFNINNDRFHRRSLLADDTVRVCRISPGKISGGPGVRRGQGWSFCLQPPGIGAELTKVSQQWLEEAVATLKEIRDLFVPPIVSATPLLQPISVSYALASPLSSSAVVHPTSASLDSIPSELRRLLAPLLPPLRFHQRAPSVRRLVFDSGKLVSLDDIVTELLHCECTERHPHRLVVFAQLSETLDLLQSYFSARRLWHVRLDGNVPVGKRQTLLEKFNADPRFFCCLFGTRAGWTGSGALPRGVDSVVLFESDWNPTFEAQVTEKCRRFGLQGSSTLRVYRLLAEDTLEEDVYKKGSSIKWLYQDVVAEGTASAASSTVSALTEEKDASRCVFKAKTLTELFPEFEVDSDSETISPTPPLPPPPAEKKQKQKSKTAAAASSAVIASTSSPSASAKAVAASGHAPPVLLECLQSLEAAKDVRAGEVTLAEMTSRLSEFADAGEYPLEPHLLGSLRDNERHGTGVEESAHAAISEEEFSLKRQVSLVTWPFFVIIIFVSGIWPFLIV